MRSMKVINPHNPGKLSGNLLQHMMWAAGSSIVFMVKIDRSLVADASIAKFRDHIDAHNKHIVRLGEKELVVDGKRFSVFCMQASGGGAFPVKEAHAETAINVFKANVIPLLGLSQEGIEFDILSTRSCARGITAQNTFRLMAPGNLKIYRVFHRKFHNLLVSNFLPLSSTLLSFSHYLTTLLEQSYPASH